MNFWRINCLEINFATKFWPTFASQIMKLAFSINNIIVIFIIRQIICKISFKYSETITLKWSLWKDHSETITLKWSLWNECFWNEHSETTHSEPNTLKRLTLKRILWNEPLWNERLPYESIFFSKFMEAYPTVSFDAIVFFNVFICRNGANEQILTDRGVTLS